MKTTQEVLTEGDGNAFAIMGRVTRELKSRGHNDLVDEYQEDATSGDYDHLVRVSMKVLDENE